MVAKKGEQVHLSALSKCLIIQQRRLERVEITNFGVPKEYRHDPTLMLAATELAGQIDQGVDMSLKPARLTDSERTTFENLQGCINQYFTNKLDRLGIPQELRRPTEVKFAELTESAKNSALSKAGGFELITGNQTTAIMHSKYGKDLIPAAISAVHEASHASARHEMRIKWGIVNGGLNPVGMTTVIGLSRNTGDTGGVGIFEDGEKIEDVFDVLSIRKFMSAMEDGLAFMDQVDVYFECFPRLFPKETAAHRQSKPTKSVQKQIKKINSGIFGPVDMNTLDPFMHFSTEKDGKKQQSVGMEKPWLKNFRFAEELCRTIGYEVGQSDQGIILTPETALQIGRDILEIDRYTGSTTGLKTMVQVLGQKRVRAVLAAEDFHHDGLKKAMQAVRSAQAEMEMWPQAA